MSQEPIYERSVSVVQTCRMQALEFTAALKEITKELKLRELLSLLNPWLGNQDQQISAPQKNQFTALLFESNSGYSRLREYVPTRKVLEAFSANEFYEPSRLGAMLSAITSFSQTSQITGHVPIFKQFFVFAELIRSLLMIEAASQRLLEGEKLGTVNAHEGIAQIELIQYADEDGISPKRLTLFLGSITELHTCLSITFGLKQDRLVVKYLDSGSGFLVGVKCAKDIAEAINTLLVQWWDRIRFWKFDSFDKKVEAVGKTLTLAEVIQSQVANSVITPEEGANLRRRILAEVEKLTGIGATAPLPIAASVDQRQLLAEMRDTKLLGSGNGGSVKE